MCCDRFSKQLKMGRLGLVKRWGMEPPFIQPAQFFKTQTCSIGATGLDPPVVYTMVSRLGQWGTGIRVWVHIYDGVWAPVQFWQHRQTATETVCMCFANVCVCSLVGGSSLTLDYIFPSDVVSIALKTIGDRLKP